MNGFMFGSIAVLALVSGFLFEQNKTLREDLSTKNVALAQQEETISALQLYKKQQTAALLELTEKNAEAEKEVRMYLNIFARHSLSKLAAAKPGLIERRVNNATKDVFESIEYDSRDLSSDELLLEEAP